jgi:hypothetical protein
MPPKKKKEEEISISNLNTIIPQDKIIYISQRRELRPRQDKSFCQHYLKWKQ